MVQIAIVDDNETWCFVLSTVLEQQGYHVELFTSAHTFLQRADQFDLAVIDFSIPARAFQIELDGVGIIQHLKTHLAHPPLLLLISSYFTDNLLNQTKDFCPQADLILGKQISVKTLLSHIKKLLATRNLVLHPTSEGALPQTSFHQIEADSLGQNSDTVAPNALPLDSLPESAAVQRTQSRVL